MTARRVGRRRKPLPADVFEPVMVGVVDVAGPIPAITTALDPNGDAYRYALSYVRWGGIAVGVAAVSLSPSGVTAAEHAAAIWAALEKPLRRHATTGGVTIAPLGEFGLGEPAQSRSHPAPPHVTVIVATRDRAALLDRCLQSLLALPYPSFDVIVVDNAPATDETSRLVAERYGEEPRLRRIHEDRPGLGIAHNAGLAVASGSIVAFTDDDVVVDAHWLDALVSPFMDSQVGCVTGMIVPARLDTVAQWWLEGYAGFSKGFEPQIYDLDCNRPTDSLFPYAAGKLGSGANMAFRTDVLRAMGGFDIALGAGSGAFGGDDLAAFFEVVTKGHRLVYQPAAMVRHDHHATEGALRRQVFGYGAGLTAFLTRTVIEQPSRIIPMIARAPKALRYATAPSSDRNRRRPQDFPTGLRVRELAGMAVGPGAYLRTRWRRRHFTSTVTGSTGEV